MKHLLLLAAIAALARAAADSSVCFNRLQTLGTHNSYHLAPPPGIVDLYSGNVTGPLGAWQYSEPPLPAQLNAGVRALELDVHWDPQGGLYNQAAALKLIGQSGWLNNSELAQPGFKVLHIPDFDWNSTCLRFTTCLQQVKNWSDANPGHLPIRIYVEMRSGNEVRATLGDALYSFLSDQLANASAPGPDAFIQPLNLTAEAFHDIAAEITSVFANASQLLTPDSVRAALGAPAVADLTALLVHPLGSDGAGTACPWPPLDRLRGQVAFLLMLDDAGATQYTQLFPQLQGSPAWVTQTPTVASPFNDKATDTLTSGYGVGLPSNADAIVAQIFRDVQGAVQSGFVVRSRADADTVEARANYTARRDAVISAGAHVISSDYVASVLQSGVPSYFPSNYSVALAGVGTDGVAGRCVGCCSNSSSSGDVGSAGEDKVLLCSSTIGSSAHSGSSNSGSVATQSSGASRSIVSAASLLALGLAATAIGLW